MTLLCLFFKVVLISFQKLKFGVEFEELEQERVRTELAVYQAQIEKEAEEERLKNEKIIQSLHSRKEALLHSKKVNRVVDFIIPIFHHQNPFIKTIFHLLIIFCRKR